MTQWWFVCHQPLSHSCHYSLFLCFCRFADKKSTQVHFLLSPGTYEGLHTAGWQSPSVPSNVARRPFIVSLLDRDRAPADPFKSYPLMGGSTHCARRSQSTHPIAGSLGLRGLRELRELGPVGRDWCVAIFDHTYNNTQLRNYCNSKVHMSLAKWIYFVKKICKNVLIRCRRIFCIANYFHCFQISFCKLFSIFLQLIAFFSY